MPTDNRCRKRFSFRGILKQRLSRGVVAQSIGGSYSQVTRVLGYWSIVNSVILLVLAWDTTIGQVVRGWLPWLTFPLFLVTVGMIVVLIMIVDFLIILPGVWAFANKQAAIHDNPVYDEIKAFRKEMKVQQDKIQKMLDAMLKVTQKS